MHPKRRKPRHSRGWTEVLRSPKEGDTARPTSPERRLEEWLKYIEIWVEKEFEVHTQSFQPNGQQRPIVAHRNSVQKSRELWRSEEGLMKFTKGPGIRRKGPNFFQACFLGPVSLY